MLYHRVRNKTYIYIYIGASRSSQCIGLVALFLSTPLCVEGNSDHTGFFFLVSLLIHGPLPIPTYFRLISDIICLPITFNILRRGLDPLLKIGAIELVVELWISCQMRNVL